MAREQFHNIQDKVRMLEALAKNAMMKAHLMKPEVEGALQRGGAAPPIPDSPLPLSPAGLMVLHVELAIAILVCGILLSGIIWMLVNRTPAPKVVVQGKGGLTIKVVKAANLPNMDADGKKEHHKDLTDAYVEVAVHGTTKKTKSIKDSLNPQWNETVGPFELDFGPPQPKKLVEPGVHVSVMDHDGMFSRAQLVGGIKFNTTELVGRILKENVGNPDGHPLKPLTKEFKLEDVAKPADPHALPHEPAKITLEISWEPRKGVDHLRAKGHHHGPSPAAGCISQ